MRHQAAGDGERAVLGPARCPLLLGSSSWPPHASPCAGGKFRIVEQTFRHYHEYVQVLFQDVL
eukprot:2789555-Pyramimonas_sp.AAC.1